METETSFAENIFGDHALQLRRYGLAVVPLARDRRPFVSGFNRWSRPRRNEPLQRGARNIPMRTSHLCLACPGSWWSTVTMLPRMSRSGRCLDRRLFGFSRAAAGTAIIEE